MLHMACAAIFSMIPKWDLPNRCKLTYLIPGTLSPRDFSYFGNINIDLGHQDSGMTDYIRWLDTKEGTTGVSYTYGGVDY